MQINFEDFAVAGIKDVSVFGNDIYIFTEQATVTRLTLLPIYQAFQLLTTRAKWQLMAHLLIAADQINIQYAIVKRVKKDLLDDLITGFKKILFTFLKFALMLFIIMVYV